MRWILLVAVAALVGCEGNEGEVEDDTATCEIVDPDPGVLDVDGTRIVDQLGRTVILRGINTGGRAKFAPYSPFEYEPGEYEAALDEYLDRIPRWGFDVLRVPFSWEAMEPQPGELDEEFLARYDALLDGAAERGLWTIVDFHQDIYAEAYCGDGFPAWTLESPPEPHHDCPDWFAGYLFDDDVQEAFEAFWSDETGVQTAFVQLWAMLVDRHWGRPGVIGFEVINEPGWGLGSYDEWAMQTLTPFYGEMAASIHADAPEALMFFDSTGKDALAAETSMGRPEGDRIVFAPHFYDASTIMGEGELTADVPGSLQVWQDLGDEWGVPVLLGEFGIEHDHPQAASHTRTHYDVFDELAMHATWWEYSVSHELWNEEDLSVVDGDGNERSEVLDEIVRPYVRALAGTRIDSGAPVFDAASSTLVLAWAPDGEGITEVMLPPRLYGGEAQVTVEGACYDLRDDRVLVRPDAGVAEVRLTVDP